MQLFGCMSSAKREIFFAGRIPAAVARAEMLLEPESIEFNLKR
jgi:hypothetical protein